MALKHHPIRRSRGDRKKLAKEFERIRAMIAIAAADEED